MEQWLPIVIIVLALVFQNIPWVEVAVVYLVLYVPWKITKFQKQLSQALQPPLGGLRARRLNRQRGRDE